MHKSIVKVALSVTLVAGLLVGVVAPVMAAPTSTTAKEPPNLIKGRVLSLDEAGNSFVIETANQTQRTVKVDSNTKYYIVNAPPVVLPKPAAQIKGRVENGVKEKLNEIKNRVLERGQGNKNGHTTASPELKKEQIQEHERITAAARAVVPTNKPAVPPVDEQDMDFARELVAKIGSKAEFSDLKVGDTVFVRLMPNEDLAKEVFILRPPQVQKITGTIGEVTDTTITIVKDDNQSVTLNWDSNTQFILKGLISVQSGQRAAAVYDTADMKARTVNITPPAPQPSTTNTAS